MGAAARAASIARTDVVTEVYHWALAVTGSLAVAFFVYVVLPLLVRP
jgi:hypothetical protein